MMSGEDRSLRAKLFRAAASCAEPFYRAAVAWRNRGYDAGRHVHRAHCRVISVGNLTTGGTGKTPMVIDLVERLGAAGATPAVVLRGYMAGRGPSDEARVYADRLPGTPIVVNPDRVAAADQLRRDRPDVDVIVLDDGFQHRRLARDVDVVLIDAGAPWGFGHLLPRGMMREPAGSLRRASAVIVTHADRLDDAGRDDLAQQITEHHGHPPIAWTQHAWRRIVDSSGVTLEPGASTRVVAFCGIGHPRPFFEAAAARFDLAATLAFSDHQPYDAAALAALRRTVERARPDALLTTEKDWVKLGERLDDLPGEAPVWRPVLGIDYISGADAVTALVQQPNPPTTQ